jgi:hypothetical protein
MTAAETVSKRRALAWAAVPAVLLTGLIGTQLVLLSGALRDPSFSVEERYYDKAVAWDSERAQERKNAELGWQLDVDARITSARTTRLVVRCVDRDGADVQGARVKVEAFHNARAGQIFRADLTEEASRYSAELPAARAGLWEFRLEAIKNGVRFTEVVRRDVTTETSP